MQTIISRVLFVKSGSRFSEFAELIMHLNRKNLRSLSIAVLALFHFSFSGCAFVQNNQADSLNNEPNFGSNVFIFNASMDMDSIQSLIEELNEQQRFNEFGPERYALLFMPGTYDLEITIDYYMQALGLGRHPDEVTINGLVQSTTSTGNNGIRNKVTTMFWRGAENMKVVPREGEMVYWAVSQAAPYRRMHVVGDINFDLGSWASGGLLANSWVEGRAGLTSGQQWFTRNSKIGSWEGGNWNRVFVGVEGAPEDTWPEKPTTVIGSTPIVREKPFLTYDEEAGYGVFNPAVGRKTLGPTWLNQKEKGKFIPISAFYIAMPGDSAAAINKALDEGKHLLLTPGIYELDETIRVTNPNTVVLGLGLPTLVPQRGQTALATDDVAGIRLAGFVVDAGPEYSSTLIEIGPVDAHADHSDNPISMHDIYCRVGGAVVGQAEATLTINSDHVIGDHFWLWRADHGIGTEWGEGQNKHGLVVNGDHVTIYGLFNEHFQEYQTLWNGEYGRTYFYQSEIPYHPPSNEIWNDAGKPGYASYKVADHVKDHKAYGLGIYCFFSGASTVSNNVRLQNAMEVPDHSGIEIRHISTFSGRNGAMNHVINGLGPSTESGELKHYDGFLGDAKSSEPAKQ